MSKSEKRVAMSWLLVRIPLLAVFTLSASYALAYYFP
jgi:hypothetical protein